MPGSYGTNRKLIPFERDGRWGFVKPDGTIVWDPVFERIGEFRSGLCSVRRNRLWGAINEEGDLQVPHSWFRELYFYEAAAEAQDERGLHLIDRSGRIIADLAEGVIDDGGPCCCVTLKDGVVTLFDFSSGHLLPPVYADMRTYSEDLAAVAIDTGSDRLLWGFIDRNGKFTIRCLFDEVDDFRSGRALVIRDGVPEIIDTSGATIVEILWCLADHSRASDTQARQGCILVTITDTLTGEVWQRDCGPVTLALRPALLIGSAAHCHVRLPGLPRVAAVVQELPTEELLLAGYRFDITCDRSRHAGWKFLWEQEEFPIRLELTDREYAKLQQGCEPEFLRTSWRMEGDDLFLARNGDFARISFQRTSDGWAAIHGWTTTELREHCESSVPRMLQAAVGRTSARHDGRS